MNRKWHQFLKNLKGKSIAILGAGVSNRPLIPVFADAGAIVTVCDKNTELNKEEISAGRSVSFQLGADYLKGLNQDYIFRSPGLRYDMPELEEAVKQGSILTSEMELFVAFCPAKIIGITGSDGKTTTSTLIHLILKEQGICCHLGGNIGTPLLTKLDDISENDIAVLELSSFQLHTMKDSPDISVITNLSPNHLDVHKSYEEYIEAKTNIFMHQCKQGVVVLNEDNEDTAKLGIHAKGDVRFFSRKRNADVYEKDGVIYAHGEAVMNASDIVIPGGHNIENYMAAIAATLDFVTFEAVEKVAKTFGGVEHRIEFVRKVNGVSYYNSSIDSSPNRSRATLNVFPQKVIMIAGGKDKGIPYDELGPVIAEHVKQLVLIGATSDKIEEAVRQTGVEVPVTRCKSYEEVVNCASKLAEDGDIVVLSPASTSFDMFRNFEERGNLFKDYVNKL
ncbi:MAG: UDP-N-acetylmuramoyl-L-alanine--D-glutamate ligase [Ruminococcaceae bacterium]|nr:UDP-N-acetylmuramoyl-L-alanine--D-glutamate ligase [Oscillospiraceae bacterium]